MEKEKQLDIVIKKDVDIKTTIRFSLDCCPIEAVEKVTSKISDYIDELESIMSSL